MPSSQYFSDETTLIESSAVTETVTQPCDKPDSGRPIGERQSPDGQEEPKTDSNVTAKPSG